jgi:hypothetical protein
MLLAMLVTACSDSENDTEKTETIKIPSGQQLDQNVYADEEKGASSIAFQTTAAWTSSIKKVTTKSSSNEDWLSISPDYGSAAGDYRIELNLQPNYTGKKRSATMVINCDNQAIEINVVQDAVTQNGEIPIEKKYDLGFIVLTTDGKLFTADGAGNIDKMITVLEDSCELYLTNYNENTKDVYIHRYYDNSSMEKISEIFAYNLETNTRVTLIKNLPSYDNILISADGNYVVFEKNTNSQNNSVVVKQSIKDKKETIIYNGEEIDNLGTISADGSTVVLVTYQSAKVYVIENSTIKYSFASNSNSSSAFISPNNNKLLIENRNNGLSELSVCNFDGSGKNIIKNGDSDIEPVFWSADSKYIYYEEYPFDNKMYRIDIEKKNIDAFDLNWGSSFNVLSFKIKN